MNRKEPKNQTLRSLFKEYDHYLVTSKLLETILSWKYPDLLPDDKGQVPIDKVIEVLSSESEEFDYIDFEHIVEIYMKHDPYLFAIEGENLISSRPFNAGKEVEPPEHLFFGTIEGVAERAVVRGLMSQKHPYVILTENFKSAANRAIGFTRGSRDTACVLKVNAKEAHEAGTEFLMGNKSSLYLAVHINKKFIETIGLHQED